MTFDRSLIHTCTIQEYMTSRNSDGEQIKTWSDKSTAVPFRFMETSERLVDPVKGLVLVTRYQGLFHHDVAIKPGERITTIVLRHNGSSVSTDNFEVVPPVLKRNAQTAHHLVVALELIK